MKNKTLMYGGIGIAVLIIGFMAYKKFGKTNEEAKETADDSGAEITKTTKLSTENEENNALVSKDEMTLLKIIAEREKQKPKNKQEPLFTKKEENYVEQKITLNDLRFNDLPKKATSRLETFKKENPAWQVIVAKYIKDKEESRLKPTIKAVAVPKKSFAGFMDFDGFPDVQGNIM